MIDLKDMDIRSLTLSARNTTLLPEFEINVNKGRLDLPLWALYEALFHELIHVYTNFISPNPKIRSAHDYHPRRFIDMCTDSGVQVRPTKGTHFTPAGGRFANLMDEMNIGLPTVAEVPLAESKLSWWDKAFGKPRGSSTLKKYLAISCPLSTPCTYRSGKLNMKLSCDDCSSKFVLSK